MELSWKALGKSGLGERFSLPSFPTTKVEERPEKGGTGQKGEERGDSQYPAGLGMRDKMNVISDGYRQPTLPSNEAGF